MGSDDHINLSDCGEQSHRMSTAQEMEARNQDLRKWIEEYMSTDATSLTSNHHIVQAVISDELDEDFVEQRILESLPNPISGRFCTKCQELFDDWPTLGGSSTREHDSKPDSENGWEHAAVRPCNSFELEASTRAGCKFCAFLLQTFKDSELLDIFRKVEIRFISLGENPTSSLCIQNWGGNPAQLLWLNLPGKICDSCNSGVAPNLRFESSFLPASASCYEELPKVFTTANNWLSQCIEKHEACKSKNSGSLPTRLISIAEESPRLVLTADYTDRPQYATLSHSWGSHKTIQLTSENMGSLMEEIPTEILPKSFEDAIEIARKLHIDFLWIDSLCIIQNDDDDWQKESALMSSVYGESVITIAASSARNSTEGCFLTPPNFNGGLRARITDGGRQRVQDFRSSHVYELSTSETHLATRAWALQEKMLPPRTIHFGDRGAFWECRTSIASEFLPDGFPRQLVSPLVRRKGKFERHWRQIVDLYSAANLTFGKDRLPALSGIAELGYNENGDQYLAGIWRKQIEEQLCWRLFCKASKRPTWRAPTWSWASVDGRALWHPVHSEILDNKYAHVMDAHTTPYGYNIFGQVSDGFVRLACSVMAVGHIVYPETSDESGLETFAIKLRAGDEEEDFPIQLDCLDDICHGYDGHIYLVPILEGRTGAGRDVSDEEIIHELLIQGVVLQKRKDGTGEYTRIGYFGFYKDKVNRKKEEIVEELYEPFLRILEEHGEVTAEAACSEVISEAEPSDHRYLITIV